MTMDWYFKNLGWIHARDEILYLKLMEIVEPRPEADWSLVDAMMGPKEWLFGLGPFRANTTILLYGFGDGEHLLHILDRMGQQGHLIVLIPDIPEFLELMHTADMEEILADPRIHPVVFGLNNDMLLRYMAACFTPEAIPHIRVFVLPGYEEAYPEGITFFEQATELVLQWVDADQN